MTRSRISTIMILIGRSNSMKSKIKITIVHAKNTTKALMRFFLACSIRCVYVESSLPFLPVLVKNVAPVRDSAVNGAVMPIFKR